MCMADPIAEQCLQLLRVRDLDSKRSQQNLRTIKFLITFITSDINSLNLFSKTEQYIE